MPVFPENVGRRQRGVTAEIDFARGSEPSQAEFRAARQPYGERRLGEVHLGRDVLHPSLVGGLGKHADGRGIAGERAVGECVDLADANAHELLPSRERIGFETPRTMRRPITDRRTALVVRVADGDHLLVEQTARDGPRPSMPEQEFLGVDQHPAQVFDGLAAVLGRRSGAWRPRPARTRSARGESATR